MTIFLYVWYGTFLDDRKTKICVPVAVSSAF
jgi:hypothetical protein